MLSVLLWGPPQPRSLVGALLIGWCSCCVFELPDQLPFINCGECSEGMAHWRTHINDDQVLVLALLCVHPLWC